MGGGDIIKIFWFFLDKKVKDKLIFGEFYA